MGTEQPDRSDFSDVVGAWADASGERDRRADEREAAADEREAAADEREAAADEREAVADERERSLNARVEQADRRARSLGTDAPSTLQRSQEASERARALLAASEARLARAEANLARAEVHNAREHWAARHEAAISDRLLDTASSSRQDNLDIFVEQLHARYLSAAGALADAHDMVAQHHERLGQSETPATEEHRRLARRARQAALHLRTAAHQATYPEGDVPPADLPH
ncbi:hypothetical protein ABZ930_13825 [Streptomyces sp. NPDC046716]|uniref:hypothetical protein n=1 Tax=Streptomyces sp. NPDC046716 TaxID=3157093 RepID=UPI0033EB50E1